MIDPAQTVSYIVINRTNIKLYCIYRNQAATSLKLLWGKLVAKLVYFDLKTELQNFSETSPRYH